MRVATFNLESLDEDPARPELLERRIEALRPRIARLSADILCLQEVNAQPGSRSPSTRSHGTRSHGTRSHGPRRLDALERLLEGTAYAGFHRAVTERGPGRGPLDVHNLVTLSRFPIVARRQVQQDLVVAPSYRLATADPPVPAPEPVAWDRPFLHTVHDLGGAVLHVLNLHLRAPLAGFVPGQKLAPFRWRTVGGWAEGFFLATVKRAGQALEARLLVDRLFDGDPGARIVVAGDCNAGETEMPLRILLAATDDTGNPDLAGRSLRAVESRAPADRRFSVLHAGRAAMLDHLLVSAPLFECLRSVEIDNDGLPDEVLEADAPGARDGSFHAPLVAGFDLDVGPLRTHSPPVNPARR